MLYMRELEYTVLYAIYEGIGIYCIVYYIWGRNNKSKWYRGNSSKSVIFVKYTTNSENDIERELTKMDFKPR